jgi:hypothetical protein
LTTGLSFYGLVDLESDEAIDLFVDEGGADHVLAEILSDEPEWEDKFVVRPIVFDWSLN